jgi:formate hydrogenlyase transcriptional activator
MGKKPKDLATLRKEAEKQLLLQTERMQSLSMQDAKSLVNELGTFQIELEMQNEELRRAQEELEASRSRYADLYDFAPVGYFSFDKNGLIVEVNLTGSGLLGVDRQHLINKPFSAFIMKDDADIFREHLKEALKRETRLINEIRLRRKNGSVLFVQLQSVAAEDPEGSRILCRTAAIDISERKQMEDEIRHQAKLRRQKMKSLMISLTVLFLTPQHLPSWHRSEWWRDGSWMGIGNGLWRGFRDHYRDCRYFRYRVYDKTKVEM